ncbi:MAG: TlyA family RNA methyltransferase [Sulfuricurvum sp.]|uniref:23S rRNA (cytidine-2'-O)-methyltransferase TlyA n=1 Tax=Sulfuricurvum sp. TaxID=2025608 RepID=UPI00260AA3A2|nr:TlyA family RNA methyltransferase [Sulfuricurvum sp.]MDD2829666.1 TlyA family RNA methyltransferase [Sulfuricurvum sp.]MDD4948666.1 TlyA family RNA methyltransferase [Sulfuricurvum sp.]
MRLDSYLVECGLVESRNKAQQLIKDHAVSVDGKIIDKVSFEADETMKIEIADVAQYVSRAAIKLKGFLPFTEWEIKGVDALDIGSSTGGFTQILLEEGVNSVTCVDVGSDQLHPSLRGDVRVSVHENTDIRNFVSEKPYELVTCDVAFIPLELILESIDTLASKNIILLFKPQFQVGREVKRDKNGVVKDNSAIGKAMIRFEDTCSLLGWKIIAKEVAHIAGKEGNQEICYGFVKG